MAALAICAYSVLSDLYELTSALVRTQFDLHKSLRYIRAKNRLKLFQFYCHQVWARDGRETLRSIQCSGSEDSVDFVHTLNARKRSNSSDKCKNLVSLAKMERAGIDFAAIEATAEAYEVIDTFGVSPPSSCDSGSHNYGCIGDDLENIEVISGLEVDQAFYDYVDALPVYVKENIGPLQVGDSIQMSGRLLTYCERFSINLIIENDTRDIALHINPRLPQNYIVRNSKVHNTWGREEVSSPLPFSLRRGENFCMEILVTADSFLISVNGYHFVQYVHRLPYKLIKTLEVKGDVAEVTAECLNTNEYPNCLPSTKKKSVRRTSKFVTMAKIQESSTPPESRKDSQESNTRESKTNWRLVQLNKGRLSVAMKRDQGLTLPYFGSLESQSLLAGRCIVIEGRSKLLPHSFYINLQQGQHFWPHPIIAFHFNPRFSRAVGQAVVCRNAWYNGAWGEEQRSELDTDLLPGKAFVLIIACTDDAFQVYINRKFIVDFKYKVPPGIVDTVYVQGDIRLWDVAIGITANWL